MSKYLPLDARIPVVLTVHDLTFIHEASRGGRGAEIDRRLRDLQQRVDRAAIVATDTDYVARELAHHVDLHGKGVHVLPLGPAPAPSPSPARPRFVPQGPFLFTLGNCLPHKNFHVLLDLVEARPETRLVLAGKKTTPYGELLERQIAARGLRGRVVMPGEITDGERQWLYEHCDAFLFPSLGEGFGLPVLEAMQAGKPVFVSRLTSLPELVDDAGFYFDSFAGPAMAAAIEAGVGRWADDEAAPARARARAAAFSWRATAQGYAGLYQSLLAP
jgi:glycosyltransferase involved in cell wall biosynthesis